jgi:hypothetical protein
VFVFLRFFSDLSFLQLRCSRFAVFGISSLRSLIPSSSASLFSGLAPLRYADPLGTFGGSSFKPKLLCSLGAFYFKKTF